MPSRLLSKELLRPYVSTAGGRRGETTPANSNVAFAVAVAIRVIGFRKQTNRHGIDKKLTFREIKGTEGACSIECPFFSVILEKRGWGKLRGLAQNERQR